MEDSKHSPGSGGEAAAAPVKQRHRANRAVSLPETLGHPLHLLLVEDVPSDAELVVRELRRHGYDVVHERAETAGAMISALERRTWDIVISDYSMPTFSALDAIAVLKRHQPDTPLIIVSGTIGEEKAVDALRAGADDFLLKDRLGRLGLAVARALTDVRARKEKAAAEEALMVADRMVSMAMLAAGVAHEINNPLASLIVNLDLAISDLETLGGENGRSPLPDGLREMLRDSRDAAQRVRRIVQDVQIFSRTTEEKLGAVNAEAVMEASLRMVWSEIRHRARLVRDYGKVPPVRASEAGLGQVFLNLLVNAAQALTEGRADANQILVATKEDGHRVIIEIADTGPGIPPEVMQNLFAPFVTTKPVGPGRGLGLAICHRLVTSFGGEISIDARSGGGTRATIALTRARQTPEAPTPSTFVVGPAVRPGRILIVDDDPMVTRTVQRALMAEHDLFIASGAREAIARVAAGERFDVILCDLMMPQTTGMDLLDELRRSAPDQVVSVIFLTGGPFTPRARAFAESVPNEILAKPFDVARLRSLINARVR